MNCTEARAQLPALLYGDAPPNDVETLHQHLAGCPTCRDELAALRRARGLLDWVPTPRVQVDLQQLYQAAARRQSRRSRWWRRATVAASAMAAGLLLALTLRLEVRVEAHQVVARWGAVPQKTETPPVRVQVLPQQEPHAAAEVEQRLQLMSNLIHALAEDLEARDGHRQESLQRIQAQLDELQVEGTMRWRETERTVAALHAAQIASPRKGE